jgi:hypothetical protein
MSSKLNAKPATSESLIAWGRQINLDRCQRESEVMQFAKFKASGAKREPAAYICKLVYPCEAVYPKCDHMNQLPTPNRSAFTPREYLDYLAKPKTVNYLVDALFILLS